jgi:hypothetical protein
MRTLYKLSLILSLLIFLASSVSSIAQTDTEFWFVAPEVTEDHNATWPGGEPIFLRVTCKGNTSAIALLQPAMAPNDTILKDTLDPYETKTYELSDSIDRIENKPALDAAFSEIQNYGLLLKGTQNIQAYYEVGDRNNPEIFVFKGENALGYEFYTPFQNILDNSDHYPETRQRIDIVSTKNNTEIVIDSIPAPIQNFAGQDSIGPVILDKGETISLVAKYQDSLKHLGGTRIRVTNNGGPIAVTISDDSAEQPGGCIDIIGDQLVPSEGLDGNPVIGSEYVAIRGRLGLPDVHNDPNDYVFMLATTDSTDITIIDKADTTTIGQLMAGDMARYEVDTSYVHIESNDQKPFYVHHFSGFGCETGGAILPPIDKYTGSYEVGTSRSFDNAGDTYIYNILSRSNATGDFLINGDSTILQSSDFYPIPGKNEWEAAQINLGSINEGESVLIRNTEDLFHLGVINGGSTSGCLYGYFSTFYNSTIESYFTVDEPKGCSPHTITINNKSLGDITNYYWDFYGDGNVDSTLSDETFTKTYINHSSKIDTNHLKLIVEDSVGYRDTMKKEIIVFPELYSQITDSSNVSCNGLSDGTATVTPINGVPPYSYQWSGGNNQNDSINTGLSPAIWYYVTITDSKGQEAKDSIKLTEPSPLQMKDSVTHVSTTGGNDGAIDLTVTGGTKPYSFNWSNGETTEDLNNIAFGQYSVTVTDTNGCSITNEFTVKEPVSLSFTTTDISCHGGSDGAIDMTINGGAEPYDIQWSTGSENKGINSLSAGSYNVIVNDDFGTQAKDTLTLTEPDSSLTLDASYSNKICPNSENGYIDISVQGGTEPYSYSWSTGATSEDISELTTGSYNVTITDSNGCELSQNFYIEGAQPYSNNNICMVTVDSLTEKNKIIWEKNTGKGIVAYNIYRQGQTIGDYTLIGNKSIEETSSFIDSASKPRQQSYQYKIAAVDTCGNESQLSDYHRTILLSASIGNEAINLSWQPYEMENGEINFISYIIYRGPSPSNLSPLDTIASNNTKYNDTDQKALGNEMYYRIAGVKENPCHPTQKSAYAEDYSLSFSNVRDNKVQNTNINSISLNIGLKVYPNPTRGVLSLTFNELSADAKINLVTITGKVVYKDIVSAGKKGYEMNLTGYEEGTYFIKLRTNNGQSAEKVIINSDVF